MSVLRGGPKKSPRTFFNALIIPILRIVCTIVCTLSFHYLLVIYWFICSGRWCIDKLGVFHANQTSMCLDPHLNKGRGRRRETGLSPLVKYFTDRSKAVLLLWIFCGFFFLSCVCYAFVCVYLYMPCGHLLGKGWPLVYNCEFVTFPLVSWVRCGTWLYRFLIFAPLLTFMLFTNLSYTILTLIHILFHLHFWLAFSY